MSEKILMTGGCGFLGQYLVRDLLRTFADANISVLDLKPNLNAVLDFSSEQRVDILLKKDICEYDSIAGDFRGVDTVIHLAGVVSFSLRDKGILHRVNVEGTRNVLAAAATAGVKRFLHVSSVAALGYGDDAERPIDEQYVFDWEIARRRKKYYMLTKHLADREVDQFASDGMVCSVFYPGLMFGPGDATNSAKLIRAIARRRIPFHMPGGTNVVDVRDVSRGIAEALAGDVGRGEYLLSGANLTFREINRRIAYALGVAGPRLTVPRFLNVPLFTVALAVESLVRKRLELTADNVHSAFKFRYFANDKARSSFGWQPQIGFEQTIRDTIEWMKSNGMLAE